MNTRIDSQTIFEIAKATGDYCDGSGTVLVALRRDQEIWGGRGEGRELRYIVCASSTCIVEVTIAKHVLVSAKCIRGKAYKIGVAP